jgi:copper chaperone CopZ
MVELTVNGMRCGPCARAVTEAVQSVDPVAGVQVDLDSKLVSIETDAEIDQIRAAIEGAGYQVEVAE